MEEKKLTEKESLEVITSMIARTKRRYIGSGNVFLLWGCLTVAVAVLIWVLIAVTRNPACNWLWFLIWIIGGIATPFIAKKQENKSGVKMYTDTLTSRIWTTVGISSTVCALMCVGFLFKGIDTWMMMLVFAVIIVPFAEVVQGIVIKEKSLVVGGAIGLLIGIFTTCCIIGRVALNVMWFMPLFIVAFTVMMIVPGHILNHKAAQKK